MNMLQNRGFLIGTGTLLVVLAIAGVFAIIFRYDIQTNANSLVKFDRWTNSLITCEAHDFPGITSRIYKCNHFSPEYDAESRAREAIRDIEKRVKTSSGQR
jgi:hypothetical protein